MDGVELDITGANCVFHDELIGPYCFFLTGCRVAAVETSKRRGLGGFIFRRKRADWQMTSSNTEISLSRCERGAFELGRNTSVVWTSLPNILLWDVCLG